MNKLSKAVPNWIVDVTLVEDWLTELDQPSYQQVVAALELLAERGPLLGRPLVDTISGARHNNMKELRPGSAGRSEIRVLFAFDSQRVAVLLVGGDKAGRWKSWYAENIQIADDRFDQHLQALNEVEGKDDHP